MIKCVWYNECWKFFSNSKETRNKVDETFKMKSQHASPPWGKWEVLASEPSYKVKRITVDPGHRLSYQKHVKRQEHWMIVQGEAAVTLDGREIILRSGEHIDIGREVAHRIANRGSQPMVFIEIQQGSYFGEDDIIRMEDDYGRCDNDP